MKVSSMTGWGCAASPCEGGQVTAELRSVNSRFLELTVRCEPSFPGAEDRLKNIVKNGVYRAKISATVTFSRDKSKGIPSVEVDEPLLEAYLETLKEVCQRKGIYFRKPSLAELLLLDPSWIHVSLQKISEEVFLYAAETAVSEAAQRLSEMRHLEGCHLAEDLDQRISFLEEWHRYLTGCQEAVFAEYEERLRKRIKNCLAENDLAPAAEHILQEAAIYAEKTDFTEEMTRLDSHLAQFRTIMDQGGPVGRKLDFLI